MKRREFIALVGGVLRQGRAGKVNGEQPRACAADERDEFAPFHVWMAPAWQEKM